MKRARLPLLYVLSFILSVGPALTFFFVNFGKYVTSVTDGIRLSLGGVMLLVITVLKVTGLLKMPPRMLLFALIFAGAYLLESILGDIIIFSFLALVGEALDAVCRIFIRREKERIVIEKTAIQTAEALSQRPVGRV